MEESALTYKSHIFEGYDFFLIPFRCESKLNENLKTP